MAVRLVGAFAVLAIAGVAAGYGVSTLDTTAPLTISVAAPVPGESPSYPSEPEVTVLPDPDFPSLERNLAYRDVHLGTDEFPLDLRVPRGWVGTTPTPGEWRWFPPPGPDQTTNTYFIRIRTVSNRYLSVPAAMAERMDNLAGAEGVHDFHVESQSGDTFVATYVFEDHHRVNLERFITNGSSDVAYASIGVIGREQDRDGLTSLLESVTR